MTITMETRQTSHDFVLTSSVKEDVWHSLDDPKSYEWWYFDALSDNGEEAIVIIFLDNFIFSPRYNRELAVFPGSIAVPAPVRYPAISFTYFTGGQAVYRLTNEYPTESFSADPKRPECSIGNSKFYYEKAEYGAGFSIRIDTELSGERRLKAQFEWLLIETDLLSESKKPDSVSHWWNLVCSRSDVTGHLEISDRSGNTVDIRHFRGTGYHDHRLDSRWFAKTVRDWHWGRAHFSDLSIVFCRYNEIGDDDGTIKLFVIREGKMEEIPVVYEETGHIRDKFGIKYPSKITLRSHEGLLFEATSDKMITASFYFLRFLSEMRIVTPDGKERLSSGICEFVSPYALRYKWLNWINDIRTGRKGSGAMV